MLNSDIENAIFCVVDFETTGLNYLKDKIIEIGCVKIENLKITKKFNKIVNPLVEIKTKITKLTGITNDMLQEAPVFEDVLPDFLNFIQNGIWVEHSNNWFDFNFFINSTNFCGEILKLNTLEVARRFLNLENYKLQNVAHALQINFSNNNLHNALEDAILTANVFLKLVELLKNNNITKISDMIKKEVIHVYKSN